MLIKRILSNYWCLPLTFILRSLTVNADYAATGCTFQGGNDGIATCDFNDWDPPLLDSDFGPGDIYQIEIENVDGTIPNLVFSDLGSKNVSGKDTGIKFQCDLENIILSSNVFTSNLDWMKFLTFKNCYVQDGISSGMLSNLTSLEEFKIDGGIVGPLTSDIFTGLTNLNKIIINADFLDAEIPSGLFTGLTSLEEIDLKSSGISSIPAELFTNLNLLTKLDLSENSLTTLPDNLFTSLMSLSTVDLGTNNWDCTCDMAWLSTWSLYTDVTIDVTCSTPAAYSGLSLNRVVASLGCINSATATTTVTVSSGSDSGNSSDSSDSDKTLTYIALGAAGFAAFMALVTSIALCCVYKKLSKLQPGDRQSKHWRRMNVREQNKSSRQPSVSTIQERPPSYNSSERMFISSPIQGNRDSKIHPYYNVSYKKGGITSDA